MEFAFELIKWWWATTGWAGLFAFTGWGVAAGVVWFALGQAKKRDDQVIKAAEDFATRTREVAEAKDKNDEKWQEMINDRDDVLMELVNKSTAINTQLAERINTIQLMILQSLGHK